MPTQITVDMQSYAGIILAHAAQKEYVTFSSVDRLGEELLSLVEGKNKPQLIFSLQDVDFLSSKALNQLIILDKKCKAAGGQWTICNIDPRIHEVLSITCLNRLFNLDTDLPTALQRFGIPVPA